MGIRILNCDVMDGLRQLADESINCVVTSPPYWGLRDYGIEPSVWGGDPACEHEWGQQISVNGTNHVDKRRWQHTRNGRDEEQPTHKRVGWLRSEVPQGAFCQHCGAWAGCLGLEPTPGLFVKHVVGVFQEVRRVLRTDGTCWLNIGDSYSSGNRATYRSGASDNKGQRVQDDMPRPETPPGLKPKDLIGAPWQVAFALQADGWWLRQDIIWAKPNPMPESVEDRCTKAHEYIFLLTKCASYAYDAEAIKEPLATEPNSQSRGPKDTPLDRGPREAGNGGLHGAAMKMRSGEINVRNKRSVWTIPTAPFPEAHFATFPPELPELCIKAGCPKGGTVLDPFSGAGTTAMVADGLGREAIGIERSAGYAEMSRKRVDERLGIPSLFPAVTVEV